METQEKGKGPKKLKIHPLKGAKIKIYINRHECAYGHTLRVQTALVKIGLRTVEKEVVLVIRADREFGLSEIDFCLKLSDVIFYGE